MTRRGWTLFIGLALCWGVPYLFIKIAVQDVDPLIVAFGRTLLGGLLLLPLALRRDALRPLLRHWKVLAVYTAIEIVGPWWLIGLAETRLNSSTTGLFLAVIPMIAAVILVVLGDDRFGPRRIVGLLIGFVGAATLVGLDVRLDDLGAIGLLFLVTIGYAVGPIIVSRRLSDLPPLGVVTISLLGAAAAYAPFTPLVWPGAFSTAALVSIGVLAVVSTAVAFLLMFALIAEAGPSRMSFVTYVNPGVAILLGALVLGEPLTAGLIIGFPLVILGSILGTWRSAAPPPEPMPPEPTGIGRTGYEDAGFEGAGFEGAGFEDERSVSDDDDWRPATSEGRP